MLARIIPLSAMCAFWVACSGIPRDTVLVEPSPEPAVPEPVVAERLASLGEGPAIAFLYFDAATEASDIKVMEADGHNLQSIPGTRNAATVSWSPDGKRLAYIIHRGDGNWSINLIDADGGNPQRLTKGYDDYNPRWSPDGTMLAFVRNGRLCVMPLSNGVPAVAGVISELTTDPEACVWDLSWSPDGKSIAFDSQSGDPHGTSVYNDDTSLEIYRIGVDGSGLEKLTDNKAIDARPSWSPDGARIVFSSNRDRNPAFTFKMAFSSEPVGAFQLYSMDAHGGDVRRLTNNTKNDMYPSWSPDGKKIAFSSDREGNSDIFVMEADGSGQTRLTNLPVSESSPAWMPVPMH